MKLLFTADLHAPADEGPYRRLAIFAAERGCGLVAIAGDLLDLFRRGYPAAQAAATTGGLRALAARVPHLAVCSGNHDLDGANGAGWLARAAGDKTGNLLVDGASAVLRGKEPGGVSLIVTCCPHWDILDHGLTHHVWLRERAAAAWAEGRRLADLHPGVPWVVLHHEPPEGSRVAAGAWGADAGTGSGAFWAAEWCRQFHPDYLLCGHIHQSPFVEGGSWADPVPGSPTWAFNPGRDEATGSRLVEIDTAARMAVWLSWDGELEDARQLHAGSERAADAPDAGAAGATTAWPGEEPDDSAEWEVWLERNRHRPQP